MQEANVITVAGAAAAQSSRGTSTSTETTLSYAAGVVNLQKADLQLQSNVIVLCSSHVVHRRLLDHAAQLPHAVHTGHVPTRRRAFAGPVCLQPAHAPAGTHTAYPHSSMCGCGANGESCTFPYLYCVSCSFRQNSLADSSYTAYVEDWQFIVWMRRSYSGTTSVGGSRLSQSRG